VLFNSVQYSFKSCSIVRSMIELYGTYFMISFWTIGTEDVLEIKTLDQKTHWNKRRFGTKDGIPLQIILNLLTLLNLLINILSSKLFSCIKTFRNKNKNFRFQTQRVPLWSFSVPECSGLKLATVNTHSVCGLQVKK
jgi:hypothetical protein